MLYIGIDPGKSGAVAGIFGSAVLIHDTPTVPVKSGRKTKNDYVIQSMASILRGFLQHDQVFAVLEKVHSMPEQGVASSFDFGRGFGLWEGLLAALGISYELVSPQRWKGEMMADMGKEKGASIVRALQLFPQAADLITLKKHEGRAEALLMAAYARGEREF
jgi:hypothetical protein